MPSFDLAIYGPLAGPLYAGDDAGPTGGAELQLFLLARGLARRGLRIAHIVSHAERLPPVVDGVRLIHLPLRTRGQGRLSYALRILQSLAHADANIYLQRTVSFETGLVGLYARLRSRPFIFSVASQFTLPPRQDCSLLTKSAYRLGLACADEIVTQTQQQSAAVEQLLGRRATLIPSISQPVAPACGSRSYFLWIGGLIDFKGPLEYLQLAERVPEACFVMVAAERGPQWAALADAVRRRAQALRNVYLLQARPRAQLLPLYERAVAVVNTSRFEGFPNVFLEGWARGARALSLHVDPDGLLVQHGLGYCANGSLDGLARAASEMWARRDTDGPARAAARAYVKRRHDEERVVAQWAQLLRRVAEGWAA